MAEAILINVLAKLANAAFKESILIYGAGGKLDSLAHELSWIRAFLKDAESKRNSDEMVKTWVNNVREVAYKIEDVIDTFNVVIDDRNQPGHINALSRVLQSPRKLPIVQSLTFEMDDIQRRLREIKDCTERYGISREILRESSSVVSMRRSSAALPDEDDPDIVGLKKDTENIIKLLVEPNIRRRCVVSIVGQGGLGKTTLARKVYNSDAVKKNFKYRIWVSVSQHYKLLHLLKTILKNIRPLKEDEKALLQKDDQHSQQTAEDHFITQIIVSLQQKRYLIVMDDVWSDDLWIQINIVLPDDGIGSRVLVTTRSSDIARKADPTCDPYNLSFLSQEESRKLLLKKSFPHRDPQSYLHNLADLPNKFAERCGGLPLALEVLGRLLSRPQPTYHSWRKIFENFSWHHGEGKKCTEILAASYEDMPFLLKPCFMYFALYPEDHQIKAKSLIRMWIAEGFIPEEDWRTMEETAEDYLEELVQRSMIQVSVRFCNGSIKYCCIHDLMRDLAIEKCKEHRFLEIISTEDRTCSSNTVTMRRAAMHSGCTDIMENIGPNLRALFFFGTGNWSKVVERFRFLKVLNGTRVGIVEGDTFKKMAQLRYISLPGLEISDHYGSQIWGLRPFRKGISCIRNLQTLDIPSIPYWTYYHLFDCIWDIKTLRHVILKSGSYGPPSNADLPNLQTLKYVKVRKEWLTKGWPKIPNIRVLKLFVFRSKNYNLQEFTHESFATFLSSLNHLTSLHTQNCNGCWVHEMRDMSTFPWYTKLKSLYMQGEWTTTRRDNLAPLTITTISFPIHLTKLTLSFSKFEEDPMSVLEKLESLTLLHLKWNAYVGRQLCCSAGGFPRLQFLTLEDLQQLEEWKANVEEKVMPILKEIELKNCPRLQFIPGLRHMTYLSKFTLINGSLDLYESLCEDESHKIREGQFVQFHIEMD